MAQFDLPLDQLERYRPERHEPADFDKFWTASIAEARQEPLDIEIREVNGGLASLEAWDLSFRGYGGHRVNAWLLMPRARSGLLPGMVEFLGYSTGRGFYHERLLWSSLGCAHLVMDTRGQGWHSHHGDTADPDSRGDAGQTPGCMTRGILSPHSYYYRRVYIDALRAVEALRSLDEVDSERIAVLGRSQGGGIALAVAGLIPDLALAFIDVPFLCHFERAVRITDAAPYSEIADYCRSRRAEVGQVFETLNYFDGVHFASRAKSPALFSAGLMDAVCPPSTVFAAYNWYAGDKRMAVYPFNGHEGGEAFHREEQIAMLRNGLLDR